MPEKYNSWNAIKSLAVLYNYDNAEEFGIFRKALDKILVDSDVHQLDLIVFIENRSADELPKHNMIHYISNNSFNFFGNIKDPLLKEIMIKNYDELWSVGNLHLKMIKVLNKIKAKRTVGINSENYAFNLKLSTSASKPSEILNFVKQMLLKIS